MRIERGALERSVAGLLASLDGGGLMTGQAVADGLAQVVSAAQQVLAVDCVGVMLLDEQEALRSVASSGPMAAALEQAQQDVGCGPGVDTVARHDVVAVTDLKREPEYAPLTERLTDQEVGAVLSAPIWVHGVLAGNLNGIRVDAHSWTTAEAAALRAYADIVGALLQVEAAGGRADRDDENCGRERP